VTFFLYLLVAGLMSGMALLQLWAAPGMDDPLEPPQGCRFE
jgi:hypothetical protein